MENNTNYDIMHKFEHKVVPEAFFKAKMGFVSALVKEKDNFYKNIQKFFEINNMELPYTADDFKLLVVKLSEEVLIIGIKYPEPSEAQLCYEQYLFIDKKFEKPGIFCIEKSDVEGEVASVCSWTSEGRIHVNYGSVDVFKENTLKKCVDTYLSEDFV